MANIRFQVFTRNNLRSMDSWTNHAYGAARLISLRGPGILDTPIGLSLFEEVKGMVVCGLLPPKLSRKSPLIILQRLQQA